MSLLEEQLEEIRKRTAAAGVTPEMAQVAAAQPEPVAQDSLLPVPQSPIEKMMERDGKAKTMGKMLLGGFTGMTPFLMPELIGGKARYQQELKDYSAQQKLINMQNAAKEYESLLYDDDPSNDMEALQMGAIHQPDVYGPVLRDRMQRDFNPAQETFTEGEYQRNPETGQWEWRMQGNQGTIQTVPMAEGFVPESRMMSPDKVEDAIGGFDQAAFDSTQRLDNIKNLESNMDDIGEEAWTAGLRGEVSEKWKQVTGTEDPVSMARKQYEGIRTSKAIQNLPPGVASDKDIELVLQPFPTSFTNYEQLREYISGLRRGEEKIREYNQFGARYLSRPGGGSRRGMAEAWDSHWTQQTSKGGKFYAEEDQQEGVSLEDEFNTMWGD